MNREQLLSTIIENAKLLRAEAASWNGVERRRTMKPQAVVSIERLANGVVITHTTVNGARSQAKVITNPNANKLIGTIVEQLKQTNII